MTILKLTGKLKYTNNWLLIMVDDEFGAYHRKLINLYNRCLKPNKPLNGSHITVIAGKYETVIDRSNWNKYQNEVIEFEYDSDIKTDGQYFWFSVNCKQLESIRIELGLPPTIKWRWHLTIGNLK